MRQVLRAQPQDLRYKPARIKLLLVAETPPTSLVRYFYFDDVREQDSLFRYVYRGITGHEPTRSEKALQLAELRDRGVFLIDLSEEPLAALACPECWSREFSDA